MSSKSASDSSIDSTVGSTVGSLGRAGLSNFGARTSLAARLTAWYAVSAFFLVVAASGLLYLALERSLDADNERVLVDRASEMTRLLRSVPDVPRELAGGGQVSRKSRHSPVYLRILNSKGETQGEFPVGFAMPSIEFPPAVSMDDRTPPRGAIVIAGDGERYKALSVLAPREFDGAAPTTAPAMGIANEPYIVQVALALSPQEKLLAEYRQRLWVAMTIALGLCIAIGYEIARRGIRPIRRVTEIATRIRSTTLDARIEARDMPAELQSLAGEFNLMLDRLQESFARISRFSADIAHELRTPVNNLRGVAEVALTKARSREEYHDALSSSVEECVRLSHIIENLLFLARAEDPQHQIAREKLDIAHELFTVADFYEASATEAGVKIEVLADEGVHASLNRTLFQRAVGNLLDNSIKNTPSGGKISLSASRQNGTLHIDVTDTGRGIPNEHVPRVFDRLYRVADDRSKNTGGSGLGLAIVKSIAHSHGGSVNIESKAGEGTKVSIAIPIDGAI